MAALAATQHQGDRSAAVEALVRSGPNVKYEPNRAYADAKLVVAWWAAALARRLPSGMAVYTVSPGSAPDTQAARKAGLRGGHKGIRTIRMKGWDYELEEVASGPLKGGWARVFHRGEETAPAEPGN